VDTHPDSDLLDTVLTLRGHQISLRQAIAEGIIKGYFDPQTSRVEVFQVDSDWFVERQKERRSA
jgi:hypothetical protein